MKKQHIAAFATRRAAILALAMAGLALAGAQNVHAQNTPGQFNLMTYQGKLDDFSGGPLDGPHDFRISVVKPPVPCYGTDCGWFTNCPDCEDIPLGTSTVVVDKGLFTLPINMPTGMVFGVTGNYLKMEVRPSGNGEFSTLLPMQRITATPLATVAQSVVGPIDAGTLVGAMPTGMLTGIFSSPLALSNPGNVFAGDGSGLTDVDATTIGGFAPCDLPCLQNFWKLTGNTGTDPSVNFIGTTDNAALTIRVANSPALRINRSHGAEFSPNIIAGDPANFIEPSVHASVIGGGGEAASPNTIFGPGSVIAGGVGNHIEDQMNVIGGGQGNSIDRSGGMPDPLLNVIGGGWSNTLSGAWSTIGGGGINVIRLSTQGNSATIAGGYANLANGHMAAIGGGAGNTAGTKGFVGGGWGNQATGNGSVVAGGTNNIASGVGAAIPGGLQNTASGSTSFAAGNRAKSSHDGAFVWSDSQNADFSSTANNQFAVRAENGVMIQSATTALDLRGDGAIRVAGAGVASRGPVFIHKTTAASVSGHITTIDNPLCNGDPDAILLVTHNWSADTAANRYDTTPVGVWYNGSQWTIFHENTSVPMPEGRAFNVMIIKP